LNGISASGLGDLRGAVVDKKLGGGWVSTERYLSEYVKGERSDLAQTLKDSAPRHVAARGWTMPDGTRRVPFHQTVILQNQLLG
jgi:hypothetical protein